MVRYLHQTSRKGSVRVINEFVLLFLVIVIVLFFFGIVEHPEKLNIGNVDKMDGYQFEDACVKILKANRYGNVKLTSRSNDNGIDIICTKNFHKYAIQCKCYNGNVGNHAVMEAYAGCKYLDCNVPVVMTNSNFTKSAKSMAEKLGVVLIDRKKLEIMMRK